MQSESNEPVSLPDAGDSSRRTLFSRRKTTKNKRRWSRLLSRDKKRAPTEEAKDDMVIEIEAQVAAGPPVLLVSGPDEDGGRTQATEAQRATEGEHPSVQGRRDEEVDAMNEDQLVNPHDEAPPVPDKPVPSSVTASASDPTPPVLPAPILPPYDLGAAMEAVSITEPAPALFKTAVHESMHPDESRDQDEEEDEGERPPPPLPNRFLDEFQWHIKTIEFLRRAVAGQERYLYAMWLRRDDYRKLVPPKMLHDWCKYGNKAHAAIVLALQEDTPSKVLDCIATMKDEKMPDWFKVEPPSVYGREEECPDMASAISELLAALNAIYAKLLACVDPRFVRPDEQTMSQVQVETLYGKASMAKLLEPFGDAKLLKNLNVEYTDEQLLLIQSVHMILTDIMGRTAMNLTYIARQTALREISQWEHLVQSSPPIQWEILMFCFCTCKSRSREEMIEPISKEVLGSLATATSAAQLAVHLPIKVPFIIPSRSGEPLSTYDLYTTRIFHPRLRPFP